MTKYYVDTNKLVSWFPYNEDIFYNLCYLFDLHEELQALELQYTEETELQYTYQKNNLKNIFKSVSDSVIRLLTVEYLKSTGKSSLTGYEFDEWSFALTHNQDKISVISLSNTGKRKYDFYFRDLHLVHTSSV